MSAPDANIFVLDAGYKAFPTFEEWSSKTRVDPTRWDRYNDSLAKRAGLTNEVLTRARRVAQRAAALDTGALEGLYQVDRGFTYTVAFETAAWEVELATKGEDVRSLFEAQLHAYDFVLDMATKAEPISEAAIRVLHEEVCRPQATYRVETSIGPQQQPLPKGKYKVLPNHVRTRNGTDHSYAPVDVTPAEMARLVAEIRSDAFLNAHPVTQATYAHYALVVIHPFADGNGRVARALASAFTYRAISMPIVILSEQKDAYIDALENADKGNYQSFVDFMLDRTLDTIQLVDESARAAMSPTVEESVAGINGLYFTKGGYTHEQVDAAGIQLVAQAAELVKREIAKLDAGKVTKNIQVGHMGYQIANPAYRQPVGQGRGTGRGLSLMLNSAAPAHATVSRHYGLWLPTDAGSDDDILLVRQNPNDIFSARVDEVIPAISGPLQIRLTLFAERVVAEMFAELKNLAQNALRKV
jgi:Fic family protein